MNKIGFNLNKINTKQFAIIESSFDPVKEEFNIETSIRFEADEKHGLVISSVKIQFEQDKKTFLIIEVSCEFDISKEFWKKFNNIETITLPKGFMAHLAMINVGTTRGVLHSRTENTKFNRFVLPTINVEQMIEKDGEFKKEDLKPNS